MVQQLYEKKHTSDTWAARLVEDVTTKGSTSQVNSGIMWDMNTNLWDHLPFSCLTPLIPVNKIILILL